MGQVSFSRIILALLLLGLASKAFATPQWMPIGPSGGYVTKVRFSETQRGVLYATAANRVFISRNGGVAWAPVGDPLDLILPDFSGYPIAQDVAEDPLHPGNLYAVTERYLLYYTARTGLWSVISEPAEFGPNGIASLTVDPNDPRRLFISGDFQTDVATSIVARSTDGGRTFKALDVYGGWPESLTLMSKLRPGWILAEEDVIDAASLSRDGGDTWTKLHPGTEQAQGVVFAPSDPNRMYLFQPQISSCPMTSLFFRSDDAGSSWKQVSTVTGPGLDGFGCLPTFMYVDAHDPDVVYMTFGFSSDILKSIDGGTTWKDLPHPSNEYTSYVAVDPFDSSHIISLNGAILGFANGIRSSWDGGVTFTETDIGITATDSRGVAVDPFTPTTLYAGTLSHIYRSTDAGAYWEKMDPLGPSSYSFPIYQMTVSMAGIPSMYVTALNTFARYDLASDTWAAPTDLLALLGADMGLIFEPRLDPSPLTPGLVYGSFVFDFDYLAVSYDYGVTWSPSDAAESQYPYAVVPSRTTPGKAFSFAGGGLSETLDDGVTWTRLRGTPPLGYFDENILVPGRSDDTFFITGGSGIDESVFGQELWRFDLPRKKLWRKVYRCPEADNCVIRDLTPDPVDAGVMYAGTMEGNLQSDDGGDTWAPMSIPGLEGHPMAAFTHSALGGDVKLASTFDSGVFIYTDPTDISTRITGGPSYLTPGVPGSYQISVINDGTVTANHVALALEVPANSQLAIDDAGGSVCVDESVLSPLMVCRLGSMAAGQVLTVTASVTLQSTVIGYLHAVGTTAQGDTDLSDNGDVRTYSSDIPALLSVRETPVAARFNQGRKGPVFSVTVANAGATDTAAQLQISYTPQLTGITVNSSGGCSHAQRRFICSLPDVPAGGSVRLLFSGTASLPGTFLASAFVKPASGREAAGQQVSALTKIAILPTSGSASQ